MGFSPWFMPGAELHVALHEGKEVQIVSIKRLGEREQTEWVFSALFLFFFQL